MAEQYESAAQQIRPDDYLKITGPIFELSGFPVYASEEGVAEFLGVANPLLEVRGTKKYGWGKAQRRKFFVKTTIPIVWDCKQGTDFLVSCNIAKRRVGKVQEKKTFQFKPSEKTSDFPSLAREKEKDSQVHAASSANTKRTSASQSSDGGKRKTWATSLEDTAAMETDLAGVVTEQPTPPTPAQPLVVQADMLTTLQKLLAPMQQQLTQLAPMYQQLQAVSNELTTVKIKVAYFESRDDSDYDSYADDDEEQDPLEDEASNLGGETLGVAKGKGRARRTNAGNATNILNKTFRKTKS